MRLHSQVPGNYNGLLLIEYLRKRFTYLSLEQWRQHVREGRLAVNDSRADESASVHTGDIVAYEPPPFVEPPADLDYRVVYEDQWLLGIDKPGNLLVHRSGRSFKSNLMYLIRHAEDRKTYPDAGLINRLDRETSGVVLVAKDPETLRLAHDPQRWKSVEKEYAAIVHNCLERPAITVDAPIAKDTGSEVQYRFKAGIDTGKEAVTRFRQLEVFPDGFSLIKAVPLTGRTHQIRVHCAFMGTPIVGDKLYSLPEEMYLRWRRNPETVEKHLLFKRQALHCARMEFEHPRTKKNCTISAPVPSDFSQLKTRLSSSPI